MQTKVQSKRVKKKSSRRSKVPAKRSKVPARRLKCQVKRTQIKSRQTLLSAVIVVITLISVWFFYFIFQNTTQSKSAPLIKNTASISIQEKKIPGLPVRLKIPKINVDAAVDSVGLTSKGAVGVPKGPSTVAWFNPSPRPGENGSSIITGHYGPWKTGQKSVFDNLYKLRKGDKIYIKDDKGVTISFVVREIRKYTMKSDASDVFISTDGKSHLNLITCEGTWDKKTKLYSNRLVVFADRE